MNKVSIIIPTYNRAHCISSTINSALNQTYPNIEIIVVDDGSNDGTAEAVSDFGSKISYFYKQNGGVSSARNFGITKSSGELIAFLDSDDIWLPEKLEKQVTYLNNNLDFGMVLCDCFYVDSKGIRTGISNRRSVLPHDGYLFREILLNPSLLPSSVLVKKTLLVQVNSFDENLRTAEDLDLHIKLSQLTKIGLLEEPLLDFMRGHDGLSILSSTYDDHVYVIERFFNLNGSGIDKAVQQESLFRTYQEAAKGKFYKLELLAGFRYGIKATLKTALHNLNKLSVMWTIGVKSFLKLVLLKLKQWKA